ncbi:MAG: serine/threonine dehydratase [Candidatus Marinimicrobia bacterium]|nr:serine/threonine dehydratase [Candidatus Neomarinimicrobiota bacterium]
MPLEFPKDVDLAAENISPFIRKTYFTYSPVFSNLLDTDVRFKMENLQVTGSFKARGAVNKLLSLTKEQRRKGVVSASTGNHGAAVAYSAQKLDISCTIFVPKDALAAKLQNIKNYGAKIEVYGEDCVESEIKAREVANLSDQAYVSPYNDPYVIAGQGTIGFEIKDQCTGLDVLIISVGGGGLIGGTASYLKSVWPNLYVVGCSPINSAVMIHSIKKGEILDLESKPTLSDGTAGGVEEDSITFPICNDNIDETVLVSETEIKNAMISFIENERLLLEGAAGTAVATLIKMKDKLKGKRVGVVICGGNISLDIIKNILS